MTQKRILIIQHVDIETPGIILNFMMEKGISFDCIKIENDNTNLLDYDGLLIMGGPMSVNDKAQYSFIDQEIALVKHYLKLHKPILGICLGSQIIASALNSSIYRNSKQELGWHNISLTQNDNTIFEKYCSRTLIARQILVRLFWFEPILRCTMLIIFWFFQ